MGVDEFSDADRREARLQSAMGALEALASGLGEAAALQILIDIVQGDMGRLGVIFAQVTSIRSLISLMMGPTGGAVTDAVGRKPCLLMGRLVGGSGGGGLLWRLYLLCWPQKSVRSYVGLQMILSVLSCGSGASLAADAMIDDRFAKRPALSATFMAKNSAWNTSVGMLSPVLGAMLYRRNQRLGLAISIICVACNIPIVLLMAESLSRQQRKRLPSINAWMKPPVVNIILLFTHSRQLARLSLAEVIYQVANSNVSRHPHQEIGQETN